jgi:2-octaprenyl-6-methoxyphenol hydroxylase
MESREKSYDIIIVGGGLVGGCLARALGLEGFKVAVVDENDIEKTLRDYHDGRSYAISLGSKRILDEIGLWSSLDKQTQPIETILVGSEVGESFLTYHREDVGEDALGFMVDAGLFRRTILSKSLESKNVTWLSNTTVEGFQVSAEKVMIETSQRETITAKLMIAADGARSQMRTLMGISTHEWKYNQLALVFDVKHEAAHQNTAVEVFTAEGPFAILPHKGRSSGCVWSLKRAYAEDFLKLSKQEMEETLNLRFAEVFGKMKLITPVSSFPLGVRQPHCCVQTRFVMVGDAAHTIHPLAGQGANLGFRDVQVLVRELTNALKLGVDIGSESVLKKYQRKRRFDNLSMLMVTDGSARVFATQNRFMRWGFAKGFKVLNHTRGIKKHMMNHAMGLMKEFPRS